MSKIKVTKGETKLTWNVEGIGELTLARTDITEELWTYAAWDRFANKIVDSAALSRDKVTGKPATPQEKFEAMSATLAHLKAGQWNAGRAKEREPSISILLVEAVSRVSKLSIDEADEWLKAKSKAEQKAIEIDPRVAQALIDIRAEKGAGKAGNDILAEIM